MTRLLHYWACGSSLHGLWLILAWPVSRWLEAECSLECHDILLQGLVWKHVWLCLLAFSWDASWYMYFVLHEGLVIPACMHNCICRRWLRCLRLSDSNTYCNFRLHGFYIPFTNSLLYTHNKKYKPLATLSFGMFPPLECISWHSRHCVTRSCKDAVWGLLLF